MKRSVFILIMLVVLAVGWPVQGQETTLTKTYRSGYFYVQFDYPDTWLIEEQRGGIQLLNYEYDNAGPNAPGEARMQFLTAGYLSERGLIVDTSDPAAFLNGLRAIFNSDDNTQGEAAPIMLGNRPAARADGTFRGNQTVYLAVSSDAGDMMFISGEAAADFAAFEPLFLQVAATAQYRPAQFADPLPPITPDNAAQVARYFEFDVSRLRGGQTDQVVFSADGTLAANVLGFDGLQIWDAITGELLLNLEDIHANQIAFSPDNLYFIAAYFNTGLQKVEISSGNVVGEVASGDFLRTVAYHPDGSLIATGDGQGAVRLWDAATLEVVQTLAQFDGVQIRGLSFSPDGSQLAATGSPGSVALWTFDGDMPRTDLSFEDEAVGTVEGVAFSGDGTRLAALAVNGSYRVFDVASGETILAGRLEGERVFKAAIALNGDGSLLAVSTIDDGIVALIDVAAGATLLLLNQAGDEVSSLAFSPDGGRLLAGGFYRDTLVIWAASRS